MLFWKGDGFVGLDWWVEGGVTGEKEKPDGVRLCQRKDKL